MYKDIHLALTMAKKRRHMVHAITRARERYGASFTKDDLLKIGGRIMAHGHSPNDSRFLRRTSNNRSIWLVNYLGTFYKVVYHKGHKIPITFLPRELPDNLTGSSDE